jgi:hypothetical protein
VFLWHAFIRLHFLHAAAAAAVAAAAPANLPIPILILTIIIIIIETHSRARRNNKVLATTKLTDAKRAAGPLDQNDFDHKRKDGERTTNDGNTRLHR